METETIDKLLLELRQFSSAKTKEDLQLERIKHNVIKKVLPAAENMDWRQVVLNGGPPCFHICEDGHFCGRALRWDGHGDHHLYTSLPELIISIITK